MRKTFILTFLFLCLFNPGRLLFGQGIISTAYQPQNLLLKKDNTFALPYVWPESMPLEILRMQIGPYENYGILGRHRRLFESGLAVILQLEIAAPRNNTVNRKVFNALYNKPKVNEKELLRQAWKEAFGIDVWYPYYKAKKVERWVKRRLSIKIFKFKGEPEFQKGQVLYTLRNVF